MIPGVETCRTFLAALQETRKILGLNPILVTRNLVELEAEQLVISAYRKASGVLLSRSQLYFKMNEEFPESAWEKLIETSTLRMKGHPLQYVIGYQFFNDHEYEVGPGVLIPRPETELLLLHSVQELEKRQNPPTIGYEIGAGSGILSIELLCRFPSLKMVASELSEIAENYALRNAARILGNLNRFTVIQSESPASVWEPWLKTNSVEKLDLVISNPPYLVQQDEIDEEVMVFEPSLALYAPEKDPLYFYREMEKRAPNQLKPGGFVFAELPHERAEQIFDLFAKPEWNARLELDLNHRNRVLIAQLKAQ